VADAIAWAAQRLPALAQARVLDVGCGEGRFLPERAFGVDLDPLRVRAARARSSRVAVADAHALPFADATFDTALANRMLNDAGRIDDVLAEIRRVLRPGGQLVVFTRARPGEGDRLDRWNGAARLGGHFARVTTERCEDDDRAALFVASS
jgi:SAM-dependent methyltransferase